MSYNVRVTIVCDEGACTNSITYSAVNSGGLNKTDAAIRAAGSDWDIAGRDPKIARCPQHHRRGQQRHRPVAGYEGWTSVTRERDDKRGTETVWRATCQTCERPISTKAGENWRHDK